MSQKDRMNTDIYVEEKMDETFVRKQIINVLIVGICITAAMAAYYFNPIISALILGGMFLLLGIVGLSYNKKTMHFRKDTFCLRHLRYSVWRWAQCL